MSFTEGTYGQFFFNKLFWYSLFCHNVDWYRRFWRQTIPVQSIFCINSTGTAYFHCINSTGTAYEFGQFMCKIMELKELDWVDILMILFSTVVLISVIIFFYIISSSFYSFLMLTISIVLSLFFIILFIWLDTKYDN